MRSRIEGWAKQGGDVERLWESVKGTEKRKGVVRHEPGKSLKHILGDAANTTAHASAAHKTEGATDVAPKAPISVSQDQLVRRLQKQLDQIAAERELRKKELEFIHKREQLLNLAIERAKAVEECGWDQRLCFGEDEWAEFGEDVLESYSDESKVQASHDHAASAVDQEMQVDGPLDESPWWCRGQQKCDRHAGYDFNLNAAFIVI